MASQRGEMIMNVVSGTWYLFLRIDLGVRDLVYYFIVLVHIDLL